jgi:hypothetical protein
MTTDNVALRIARIAVPSLDLDDASAAIDAITARGCEFVSPGMPGRMLESEEAFRNLANYLRTETGLSFAAAFGAIDAIAKLGFKIRASTSTPTEPE